MAQDPVRRESFILRVWREGKNQAWKSWIQHADSGASTIVYNLADLWAFIEQHTNEPVSGDQPAPPEKFSGLK
ncbi:MAG: hypothetical protein JXB15_15135 [Anaerolineales bacterium]|nr:hypothetical protein [Anaerolineales bacterium]